MKQFPELAPFFPGIHQNKITEYFDSLQHLEAQPQNINPDFSKLKGVYFLCFTNRCGSNFVAQALSSDGRLAQAGENINYDTVIKQSKSLGISSFPQYFSWLANNSKGKMGIFGCKASVEQLLFLYNEGLLNQFPSPPKFIHITRSDTLSQAVSLYIASKTNKWTSEQKGHESHIDYDAKTLLNIVKSICQQNAMFQAVFQLFGVTPMAINYEDFMNRPRKSLSEIGEFISIKDLEYKEEKIRYKKQADDKNAWLLTQLKQDFNLQASKNPQ